jgi:hypothetical protein
MAIVILIFLIIGLIDFPKVIKTKKTKDLVVLTIVYSLSFIYCFIYVLNGRVFSPIEKIHELYSSIGLDYRKINSEEVEQEKELENQRLKRDEEEMKTQPKPKASTDYNKEKDAHKQDDDHRDDTQTEGDMDAEPSDDTQSDTTP